MENHHSGSIFMANDRPDSPDCYDEDMLMMNRASFSSSSSMGMGGVRRRTSSSSVSEISNATSGYYNRGENRSDSFDEFSLFSQSEDLTTLSQTTSGGTLMFKVQFKSTTDDFYLADTCTRDIAIGDYVKVEADRGHDVGMVSDVFWPTPEEIQAVSATNNKQILSIATSDELLLSKGKSRDEARALSICKDVISSRNMAVNLVDAEYQYDRKKLTFFFTSDGHTDFRELVRDLFTIFKTRIWMQKIKPFEAAAFRNTNSPIPRFNGGGGSSPKRKGGHVSGHSAAGGGGHSHQQQQQQQQQYHQQQQQQQRPHGQHSHGSTSPYGGPGHPHGHVPNKYMPSGVSGSGGGGGSAGVATGDMYRTHVHQHQHKTSGSNNLLKQATHHAAQCRYFPRGAGDEGGNSSSGNSSRDGSPARMHFQQHPRVHNNMHQQHNLPQPPQYQQPQPQFHCLQDPYAPQQYQQQHQQQHLAASSSPPDAQQMQQYTSFSAYAERFCPSPSISSSGYDSAPRSVSSSARNSTTSYLYGSDSDCDSHGECGAGGGGSSVDSNSNRASQYLQAMDARRGSTNSSPRDSPQGGFTLA